MKVSMEIRKALNEQLNRELYAEYAYMTMAAYFFEQELLGFGRFFLRQSAEERTHARKLFNYLIEKGISFEPLPIEIPPKRFDSPLACFQAAWEYEKKVTLSYYNLFKQVRDQGEYELEVFLQWYLSEQREEENLMQTWTRRLEMAGDNKAALLILDREAEEYAKAHAEEEDED
jgi:ferritin